MRKPAKRHPGLAGQMSRGQKSSKRPSDVNQLAHMLGKLSTGAPDAPEPTESEISRVMAVLGRKGGLIGGKKRAASLSPEKRREIALKAARSRWDKKAVAKA